MNQIHRFVGKGYDVYCFSGMRLGFIRPNQGNEGGISMNRKILAASLAVLSLSGGAFCVEAADMPVYTLDGIVVTASRVPEKKIDSNADVSVVTAKEIEEKHYDDVSEAIRHVPGVNIANYSGSGQNYSTNKMYINGSSNVVVMVDGIRRNINGIIGNTANLGDLVNMDSIAHIEVLKGSASTLYGSDAEGGVINIITRQPQENGVKTTLRTSFGNEDKENYTLYNEGREGKFFWTLEAGKELVGDFKDGWGHRVINHLNAEHYDTKIGYDLGNDSSVVFNYQKYKSDYIRPDVGSNDKAADKGKKDNDSISLQYKAKINDRLSSQFSVYRNRTTFKDNYNLAGSWPTLWDMGMKTTGISDQLTYKLENQTIIGGFDWYKDEITHYHNIGLDGSTVRAVPDGTHVSNTAFYLQDKIDITKQWNITPGVRFDHHSKFGNHTSPSLSLGYKKSENTNYYLNYKTFFVAPNLFQLYSPKYGRPDLDPQEGNTVEFGINHRFSDSLTGTFNVFHTHAKNILTSDGSYRAMNSGKTDVNGFNISLDKEFSKHWEAGVGYSYLHASAQAGKNINLDGVLPESTLNVNVTYKADKFNASLDGRGVMNRYGNKACPEMRNYANYWVWDVAANYQFAKGATLFARVNNIFDQFYTDVGSSYGPDTQHWYSAPGRNFEIGMQFTF